MKRISQLILPRLFLILGFVVNFGSMVHAQGQDIEPNNACTEAQDVGPITIPFTVDGSLDTPPDIPDVDFFRFTGQPGTEVRVDYEGQGTGKGTLSDPFSGII